MLRHSLVCAPQPTDPGVKPHRCLDRLSPYTSRGSPQVLLCDPDRLLPPPDANPQCGSTPKRPLADDDAPCYHGRSYDWQLCLQFYARWVSRNDAHGPVRYILAGEYI